MDFLSFVQKNIFKILWVKAVLHLRIEQYIMDNCQQYTFPELHNYEVTLNFRIIFKAF